MADITSLTITYEGNNVWSYQTNLMVKDAGASFYDGTWIEDLVTFKTDNGGILLNNIPYDIIEYVDSIDSGNNFTPTSAKALIVFLKGIGFFDKSIGSGSGADTFLKLGDTFPNYFGRALQWLRINADETLIESVEVQLVQYFQDLLNVPNTIGAPNANKMIVWNNTGTALIYVDRPTFDIPIPNLGMKWIMKGYHWENILGVPTKVENQLQQIEIGDYFSGALYSDPAAPK